VLQPNKSDALSYLAGSSTAPDRWARVAIIESATEEALIVNYKVITTLSPFFHYSLTRNLTGWTFADPRSHGNLASGFLLQLWSKLCIQSTRPSSRAASLGIINDHEYFRHYTSTFGKCQFASLMKRYAKVCVTGGGYFRPKRPHCWG
jgi:hypothetical protein